MPLPRPTTPPSQSPLRPTTPSKRVTTHHHAPTAPHHAPPCPYHAPQQSPARPTAPHHAPTAPHRVRLPNLWCPPLHSPGSLVSPWLFPGSSALSQAQSPQPAVLPGGHRAAAQLDTSHAVTLCFAMWHLGASRGCEHLSSRRRYCKRRRGKPGPVGQRILPLRLKRLSRTVQQGPRFPVTTAHRLRRASPDHSPHATTWPDSGPHLGA